MIFNNLSLQFSNQQNVTNTIDSSKISSIPFFINERKSSFNRSKTEDK